MSITTKNTKANETQNTLAVPSSDRVKVPAEIRILPSGTLLRTLDLKVRHGTAIVARCCKLNSTSTVAWTLNVINCSAAS